MGYQKKYQQSVWQVSVSVDNA